MATETQAKKALESAGIVYDPDESDATETDTYVLRHPSLPLTLWAGVSYGELSISTSPSEELRYGEREYKRLSNAPYGLSCEIPDLTGADTSFVTGLVEFTRDRFLALQ